MLVDDELALGAAVAGERVVESDLGDAPVEAEDGEHVVRGRVDAHLVVVMDDSGTWRRWCASSSAFIVTIVGAMMLLLLLHAHVGARVNGRPRAVDSHPRLATFIFAGRSRRRRRER